MTDVALTSNDTAERTAIALETMAVNSERIAASLESIDNWLHQFAVAMQQAASTSEPIVETKPPEEVHGTPQTPFDNNAREKQTLERKPF